MTQLPCIPHESCALSTPGHHPKFQIYAVDIQGSLANYQKLNQIIKKVSLIKVSDIIHLLYAILIIIVQ